MDGVETREVTEEDAKKAEELKNQANECFKGEAVLLLRSAVRLPYMAIVPDAIFVQRGDMTLLLSTTPKPLNSTQL